MKENKKKENKIEKKQDGRETRRKINIWKRNKMEKKQDGVEKR